MKFQKIKIKSYAAYRNSQSCLQIRAFYSRLGGSSDVALLSENHHKINLITREDLM